MYYRIFPGFPQHIAGQSPQRNLLSVHQLEDDLNQLTTKLSAVLSGVGRLIAKADAMYAKSEDDPGRVAESGKLGDQVIERLRAEQQVLEKYGHAPKE